MTGPEKGTKTARFGKQIISLDTVDSTNSFARSLLESGAGEGSVVVAGEQTAGRGRQGRVWSAEKGKNLTFSLILKPGLPAELSGLISLYASLSVAEAIGSLTGLTLECKWPNDVLMAGLKVCGILSESSIDRGRVASAIVGIGLNVNQTLFPPELKSAATSLQLIAGRPFELHIVLASLLERLERRYPDLLDHESGTIPREWINHSGTIGRNLTVRTENQTVSGLATGLAADGGLLLLAGGIERKISAGDISIHP
ncbi:MAG TPA: biotin--[acetyl-CoA-carboxylase] ligase [Bacteroidota bacterium]|jgi:BirA family biotin operon repressor/biotin-[acetyl-CoA-carboxylase] ligase